MDGIQNIVASSTSQQINSENTEENASCNIYARTFRTNRGLLQHLNFCRRRNITNNGNQTIATNDDNNDNTSNSNNTNGNDIPDKIQSQEKFYWNLVAGSTSEKDLKLWDEGNIVRLLYEGTTIQKRLRFDKEGMTIAKISLKFKNLMSKGNDNGALKLLADNKHSGILPLNKEMLKLLIQKHPEPREPSPDILIQGPTRPIHPVAYDGMDE